MKFRRSTEQTRTGVDRHDRNLSMVLICMIAAVSFLVALDASDSTMFKPVALKLGAALLVATGLWSALRSGRLNISLQPLHLPVLFYLLAAAGSLLVAVRPAPAVDALLLLLCVAIAFFATTRIARTLSGARTILHGIGIITAVTVVYALIQYLSPDTFVKAVVSKERSILSTFCNAMYFGGFLVLVLPISLALARTSPAGSIRRIAYIFLSAAIMFCVIITESRSAWFGTIAGVLIFGLISAPSTKARLIVVGVIAAGILVAIVGFQDLFSRRFAEFVYGGATSSFSRRVLFYDAAWKAFLDSPVLGHGIGNFALFAPIFRSPHYWMSRSEDIVPHTHNEFLQILSENGLVGFLAFAALLVLFFRGAVRSMRNDGSEMKILQTGFVAAVVGTLVDNLASMDLRTTPVALLFWVVLGLSSATAPPVRQRVIALPRFAPRLAWVAPALCLLLFAWYLPRTIREYRAQQTLLSATMYHYQGFRANSVAEYELVLNTLPDNPEALIYLGNDILRENPRRAREVLTHLLDLHPYYPKGRILLAMATLAQGDTAAAFNEIDRELLVEDSPDAVYYAASLAYHAGALDRELKYLGLLFENGSTAARYDHIAQSLERAAHLADVPGTREKFLPVLRRLREVFNDDPDILVPLAEVFAAYGDREQTVAIARRARELPSVREEQIPRLDTLLHTTSSR